MAVYEVNLTTSWIVCHFCWNREAFNPTVGPMGEWYHDPRHGHFCMSCEPIMGILDELAEARKDLASR